MSKKATALMIYALVLSFILGLAVSYLFCRVYFAAANITVDGRKCYQVEIGVNNTAYANCNRP